MPVLDLLLDLLFAKLLAFRYAKGADFQAKTLLLK